MNAKFGRFCAWVFVMACARGAWAAAPVADDAMNDDPAVEKRLLDLAPGFEIQLFASEPEVINPVTMNFDAKGRLWVLCIPGYPQVLPDQNSRDFITVLDPADEAGRTTGAHVFATGLTVPTGMIPGDGGAYVGQADVLLHLKDTDGDGKSDQRRVLLTGFGTQDTHHTLNTFRWGPDGRLYFNQGIYILSSVETPRGLRRLFGGCVWQFRPDSLELEVHDRSILPNNTWGHVFDDWGRELISSAWPADINLLLPETPLNSSNEPNVVPSLAMTKVAGDRHSGLERITGRHFPEDWQGNLVSGQFQAQRVNRFRVEEGADGRMTGRQLDPLLVSRHGKFRPVDMKVGPDGALYVADWYDMIIQHNQVNFRDPRRDHGRGRIWRITAKGRPLVERPDLAVATPALLGRLKDPEQWTRDQARRVLAERDKREVAGALANWVGSIGGDDANAEHHLLEALWAYQTIDVVEPGLLKRLLGAKEPRARAAAVGVLGYWHDRVSGAVELLSAAARDADRRVRLNAVLAAQRIPSAGALEAALGALGRETDVMVTFELRKAVTVLRPYWFPAFEKGEMTFGGDDRRVAFALLALNTPEVVPHLLALAGREQVAGGPERWELLATAAMLGNGRQAAVALDAVFAPGGLDPAGRAGILEALAEAARTRKVVPEGDLSRVALLVGRGDALGVPAARAAGAWRLEKAVAALTGVATNEGASTAHRQAAIAALGEIGGESALRCLEALAEGGKPPGARVDAIAALAPVDLPRAAKLAARFFGERGSADSATGLFAAMLRRAGGGDALAAEMASVPPDPDLARFAMRELATSGVAAPRLAEVLRGAAEVGAARRKDSPEEVRRLAALAASTGNPARGEQLFRGASLGCIKCHAIAGGGGTVGPDLAAIGGSAPADVLVEKVLNPERRVREGFAAFVVETKDGDAITGLRVRENGAQLVLKDAVREEVVVAKERIKSRRPIGTLMPSGLADGLTDGELADLVSFLSALGKPGAYEAGHAAVARRWWALATYPKPWGDTAARPKLLAEPKGLPWVRQYTTVAGVVPLEEVLIGSAKAAALLRCEVEVTSPGKIGLKVNDPRGLQVWVDAAEVPAASVMTVDLAAGRHTVDFWVDVPGRERKPLSCELVEVAGGGKAGWGG